MDFSLDGKVAVVTGGSRGIGRGIAVAYAEAGAQVLITSRNAESCAEAAEAIGHGCQWIAGHAGRQETIDEVTDAAIERFGGLDVLVNNAATNPYAGPTIDVDLARWEKTLALNVTAPLLWTQAVWTKRMKEHGGVIVNISSVGGLATNVALGVYDITKAALIHLTKQLAAELGPQVRVNAIAPGLIKTDFARILWEGPRGPAVADSYPLKRLGEVEDIAAAALWLAAESGSWITGQTIVLDGGGLVAFHEVG